MMRRVCGYQIRIKVNAFRLRAGVASAGRKLGMDAGISGLASAEAGLQAGSAPGGQRLEIGGGSGGRRVDKDYGGLNMEPAEGDLQGSSSDQMVPDPSRGKKPISPFALEKASEIKVLLDSDLSHHYSIGKLARKVGTNAKTLQDGFKQLYGKTIFEYGQGLRLEHGKKLLRATDQSIQEISEACGYAEQANFTAAFRKKYGVAPGVWRKGGK